MDKITQYNQLIEEIVYDFVVRLYKEEGIEEEVYKTDYYLMDYQGIYTGMIDIWDRFLNLDNILLCEKFQIPTKLLIEYYDKDLEARMKDEYLGINFYNFALKNITPKRYKQNQDRELKESENKAKQAKKDLEKIIKERA